MQDNCPAFPSLEAGDGGLEGASAVVPRGVDRGQLRPCAGAADLEAPEISPTSHIHPLLASHPYG